MPFESLTPPTHARRTTGSASGRGADDPTHSAHPFDMLKATPTPECGASQPGRGRPAVVAPTLRAAPASASREAVSSAENLLVLLVALRERGRLRVAEAAALLSVTPPTAHRLLTTLKRHQFAEQDRQRAYLPGPQLRAIRPAGQVGPDLHSVAHPHLERLAHDTQETVHLVVLQGNGSRFIDGVESTQALRVGSRAGLLLPAHVTSGGKVLLAQLPDAELLALYPDRQVQLRDGSKRDLGALRRELSAVRRQGYALNQEGSERGVSAVGVPVLSAAGRAAAAVVLALPSLRCDRQQLVGTVERLRATADAIGEDVP